MLRRILPLLFAAAGCAQGADVGGSDATGETRNAATLAPLDFNGGFEARDFPYTGSCTCVDHDNDPSTPQTISCTPAQTAVACSCRATGAGNDPRAWTYDVICSAPIDIPYGWTNPGETFRPSHGNGGVFFLYGAGRNPGPPRSPGYKVPDGTALYFQTCDDSDRWSNSIGPSVPPNFTPSPPDGLPDSDWCFRTSEIVTRSSVFSPTPGATYKLSAWFRSTIFMSVGTIHENKLEIRVRFLNSGGAEAGVATVAAPLLAPVESWSEISGTLTVPNTATSGVIEVAVGRDRQSNVYVDDISLTAL